MAKEKTKVELMKEIEGLEKATGELATECGRTKETLIRVSNENAILRDSNAKLDDREAENADRVNVLREATRRSMDDELCELLHLMDLIRAKATRISMMNRVLKQH